MMLSREGAMRNVDRATLGGNNLRIEQVLESATRLFTEKGYEAASVRDLAAELEIRPSSLYHHFPGKQHILFAICMRMQTDFNAQVMPELSTQRPPDQAIASAVRQHVIFGHRRKGEVVVNIRERRSLPAEQLAQVNALRREYRDTMARVIEAGCERGVFRVGDPKLAAMAIVDMINGLPHWFKPRDEDDLERVADLYARAAVALLRGWDTESPA
jgi:AcrR family transcriptional regulator